MRRTGDEPARPHGTPETEAVEPRPAAGAGKARSGEPRRERRGATAPVPEPPRPRAVPTPPAYPKRRNEAERRHPADDGDGERGLRGLVGAGSSQVDVAAAMRARDAARPTADDLADAERDLTIVRRHWVPRDPA